MKADATVESVRAEAVSAALEALNGPGLLHFFVDSIRASLEAGQAQRRPGGVSNLDVLLSIMQADARQQ